MINASYGGQTYSNVNTLVASDGTTNATVTLSESGVIPTPAGTKEITQNGTGIDVMNYASVNVNVSGGGSGSVGGLTEYNSQTVVLTQEAIQGAVQGVKIAHGLTKAPKIFRMKLNYSGTVEDHKGYIFGLIGACNIGGTDRLFALTTNMNTGALSSAYSGIKVANLSDITTYGPWMADSDYLYLTKPASNQNYDSENAYTIECWA